MRQERLLLGPLVPCVAVAESAIGTQGVQSAVHDLHVLFRPLVRAGNWDQGTQPDNLCIDRWNRFQDSGVWIVRREMLI